jgi:cysteine desulfurase
MTRHYLDHAATTPMLPVALEAMTAELTRVGNASALHGSGRRARMVVEDARECIAAHVGASPQEVVFTSGGTESDNLAVKGGFWTAQRRDGRRTAVVTTTVEHHAVLDSVGWLAETQGARVRTVAVDSDGRADLGPLGDEPGRDVALVSVIWGNNEVGTLQPVAEAAGWAASVGALSHSDAVQAVGHVPVDFASSGLDLLSFTGHKLGGPYGVGALLVRRGITPAPILHGGGQERDLRSGTLNVAAVAGFAAAVQHATAGLSDEAARVRALRRELLERVAAAVSGTVANGPAEEHDTLPGIASVTFDGCEADALLMVLDAAGIDCSAGSACSAGVTRPSHVMLAMGRSEQAGRSTLRFSLGHSSTAADVGALLAALPEAVARARAAGSLAD